MVVDALMRFLPVQVRLELLAIRRLIGWPVVNLCSIFVLLFAKGKEKYTGGWGKKDERIKGKQQRSRGKQKQKKNNMLKRKQETSEIKGQKQDPE